MLENLIDLVKQNAGKSIIDNPAIPNEQNDAAIATAGSSIMDGLKNMISQGNVQDVMALFNTPSQQVGNTAAAQQLSGGFIQNLVEKFGLNQGQASGIAGNLIPQVLQKFVNKTNDPNDSSFDLPGILGNLTGGQGAGGLNVQDLLGKFTQGEGGSNKGIMDSVTQLFGK
jgi:hypothetical protein